ncbi:MAG TPA: hypothetical protein DCF62_06240 [Porticoccaceae bacterium]|nr:hypothetical protein [Porticoccaceae bacterium]HCO59262.1 hypothetical protein [Porticoccaceae bacterium]
MGAAPEPKSTAFRWRLNLKVMAFTAVFLPLMLSLGFWQLSRAQDKRQILEAREQRINTPAVALEALVADAERQFVNVYARGQVDNQRTFLEDNQIRRGRPGYEVLTPMQVELNGSDQWLLLNRGWVAGGIDRSVLPEIPPLAGQTVSGYLHIRSKQKLVLKEAPWPENRWPLVIQKIDLKKIEQRLGLPVYPYVLRVTDAGPLNSPEQLFDKHWTLVSVQPQKHTGYAVQWFTMATALVILTIFANSNLSQVLRRGDRDMGSQP